ncbi:MAG: hypothetical protein LBB87_04565, partial [Nitrososphaerota archaeon]|nr:hypothetical protein [Nitrososphaerota archaeon]
MNKIIPFILLFCFISGTFATVLSSVSASELIEDSWYSKTSMPSERKWFGVVVLDDKIYAIGGSKVYGSEHVGTNERYDPKTNMWITLSSIPTPRINFGVVTYQDKIYCIGGEVPYFGPILVSQTVDAVEVYDPVNDLWSTKASFPTKVSNPRVCVVNNQLFVITYDGKMYLYNPSNDTWSSKTSIPVSTTYPTVRVINGQIFAICSSDAGWEMFMYNQLKNSWTKKANPYVLHGAFECIVVDNKILICDQPMHVDNLPLNFRIYDPETDKWSEGQTATNLTKGYGLFVGATYGVHAPKNGYVFGMEPVNIDTVQMFTWIYNPAEDVWLTAKPMPILLPGLNSVVAVDDILYIIGECGTIDQYVPIGYSTTPLSSEHVPLASEHSTSKPFLAKPVMAVIVL